MSYQTTAYDVPSHFGPAPVVILTVQGTHDVSRIVSLLVSGNCEQLDVGHDLSAQLRQHSGGRVALELLNRHGGPDLTAEPAE